MGRGKKVLIVEDESLTAMALSLHLQGMGYEVLGFSATGEEAVQRAQLEHPDIVFMDVSLAGKMDGIEAARLIARAEQVSIVLMTGFSTQEMTERVAVNSLAGYLVKPIDFAEISGILSRIG
jgi:two-component system, response regulator PdtaR